MSKLTRLDVRGLHGFKDLSLRIENDTMILVGENGAGKTTLLKILYYLLSGQWTALARYNFDLVEVIIDGKNYPIRHDELEERYHVHTDRLNFLPPPIRRRLVSLAAKKKAEISMSDLEQLCRETDFPLRILTDSILSPVNNLASQPKVQSNFNISESLTSQLLYLPTYRRIEQELSIIFKGIDERELKQRNDLLSDQQTSNASFVELIEFGMKDVERAIKRTLSDLSSFARETLNDLTFRYLGDIVDKQYARIDFVPIRNISEEVVDRILNRIHEKILTDSNKTRLKDIIRRVKDHNDTSEFERVVCHYFIQLMKFQEELEKKEARVTRFCKVCNEYFSDKSLEYDSSKFSISITPRETRQRDQRIELNQLSSGEKQIVSLFSHLYLSEDRSYYVLIDEPELSLSVPWQRKFLVDIRNADFCTGLVAVTHSPFIYDNELRHYAHGIGEFIK